MVWALGVRPTGKSVVGVGATQGSLVPGPQAGGDENAWVSDKAEGQWGAPRDIIASAPSDRLAQA